MSPRVFVNVVRGCRAAAIAGALTAVCLTAGTVAGAGPASAVIPVPAPGGRALEAPETPAAGTDPADPHVLVNKTHPLAPHDWAPDDLVRPDMTVDGAHDRLRADAAQALAALADASERATGRELVLVSGYRSAEYQERLYRRYVERHGRQEADTFSARAGHSEHQTGLAADVTEDGTPYTRFGGTGSSRWVADHAWRYGYVVRYPQGEQDVTGYAPEPWHLRYVGRSLATRMHHEGQATLEQAFDAGPAPAYAPAG